MYEKLSDKSWEALAQTTFVQFHLWLLIPIILLFANWSVEAMKWQFVAGKIEKITFFKAIKGTLTGVSLSAITPAGIGDYIGRILQLDNEDRFKAIGAVLIANLSQLFVTVLWGTFALIVIFPNPFDIESWWVVIIWWMMPVITLSIAIIFIFNNYLLSKLKGISWLDKVYECLEVISYYSYEDLLYLFCLSLFRYFIFTAQFVMILFFFGVSNNISLLLLGVNFIFLIKTIVPTLFDLGVRESAALFYFGMYGISEELVLLASLSLWFINIIIPSIIGLIFLFKLKVLPKS